MMPDASPVGTGMDLLDFLEAGVRPSGARFTELLIHAAAAACEEDLNRLRRCWPQEVITWEIWQRLHEMPTAGQLRALVATVWVPRLGQLPDPHAIWEAAHQRNLDTAIADVAAVPE